MLMFDTRTRNSVVDLGTVDLSPAIIPSGIAVPHPEKLNCVIFKFWTFSAMTLNSLTQRITLLWWSLALVRVTLNTSIIEIFVLVVNNNMCFPGRNVSTEFDSTRWWWDMKSCSVRHDSAGHWWLLLLVLMMMVSNTQECLSRVANCTVVYKLLVRYILYCTASNLVKQKVSSCKVHWIYT